MQNGIGIEELVAPHVRGLPPYNAGRSNDWISSRYSVSHIARLCSNESPFGPSPDAMRAAIEAVPECNKYPDSIGNALREALASRLGVAQDRLIIGNGSEDLIVVAYRTLLRPGNAILTVSPGFGLHTIHAEAIGCKVKAVPFSADMRFDIDAIRSSIDDNVKILALSSPSNPVGVALNQSELASILEILPRSTLLLLDEAYYEYAAMDPAHPNSLSLLQQFDISYLVLRTFSKAYGLAGLRVGYGIASHPELIVYMDRMRTPFNTNSTAQAAALAALDAQDHMAATVAYAIHQRQILESGLRALNLYFAPSCANFLFVDTRQDNAILSEQLMRQGIIVKPWTELGFTRWIRVTAGAEADNRLFLEAMRSILEELSLSQSIPIEPSVKGEKVGAE